MTTMFGFRLQLGEARHVCTYEKLYYPEMNPTKHILSYKHVWFLVPRLPNLSVCHL